MTIPKIVAMPPDMGQCRVCGMLDGLPLRGGCCRGCQPSCTACNGLGVVPRNIAAPTTCSRNPVPHLCSVLGKRKIVMTECPQCGGAGWVGDQ